MEKIKLFVDGGMKDDSFVDEFSEIVIDSSRDGAQRKANFKKVLEILFMKAPTPLPTTISPSKRPTSRPTWAPTWPSDGAPNAVGGNTLQPGTIPGEQDPAAGPISNPNQQPASTPNRPVLIDISAPRPNNLPSNTIVDLGEISSSATHINCSSGPVWALFVLSCSALLLCVADGYL